MKGQGSKGQGSFKMRPLTRHRVSCFVIAALASLSRCTAFQRSANRAAAGPLRGETRAAARGQPLSAAPRLDASHPLCGALLTVRCPQMSRGGKPRYATLKCYDEAGDPHAKPLPYVLEHDEQIVCLDYRDFAGQTWVLHEVDEKARGLTKAGAPREDTYLAWSPMAFQGHMWLVDPSRERPKDEVVPPPAAKAPKPAAAPVAEPPAVPRLVDAARNPYFGKRLTVRCPKMSRGGLARHATLKCFPEAGDPYARPFPYVLAHDDFVTSLDFVNFAGQTWVLHEVDETARGLTKDGAPPKSEKYTAWSYMDFNGHRWLVDESMERPKD